MKALFISRSISRSGWYRCVLPAMFGSWDWVAIDGEPPGLSLLSSWVEASTREPDLLGYDVVILQQVRGPSWAKLIRKLRERNVKVLYEVDDYLHGVRKADDHDFRGFYTKEHLKQNEMCMRACDGAIVSTVFLAEKYRRIFRDRPIWVCENGLDMGRYRYTHPSRGELDGRETVTIVWAGGTGHQRAALPWIAAVRDMLIKRPHVSFVSIGQDFAALLRDEFPGRTLSVPFSALETYPAAMMLGDISIAPAGKNDWYRAKSVLRAMESAALGIPIVADKHYESAVVDGETGFVVGSALQARSVLTELVDDDERRLRMSERAKQHAQENFSMDHRVGQWERALSEATSSDS